MGRWLTLLAVGVAACAAPGRLTMSWPAPLPGVTPELPIAIAVGGGLETGPMRSSVRRVVHHNTDLELPPGAPKDGHGYLLLQWPLPATGVNSLYGRRADPLDGFERDHNGVDLEADYGAVVSAAADGVVVWAGWNSGHGRQVIIEHRGGYRTGYSHLSQLLTFVGSAVRAGDPIGLVGSSGRSTGPHLHFEVTRDDAYVDPLDVLGLPQPID
jgi:murein DD-endopeptidase MepM/ murein hydrolase activator NlpD